MRLWVSLWGKDFAERDRKTDSLPVRALRAAIRSRSWPRIRRAVAADKHSRIVDRATDTYPQDGLRVERRGVSLAVYQ